MIEPAKDKTIFFIYDGECPICQYAALALKIKKDYGSLMLLDARESSAHPLLQEINRRGLDLDTGMVIVAEGEFFHGREALLFMARYNEKKGLFNHFISLFKSELVAQKGYPWLRATRNLLLKLRKKPKINNLHNKRDAIFATVFGDDLVQITSGSA